jgi:hypothetical protein
VQWAPLDLPYLFNGLRALSPGDPGASYRVAQLTESAQDTLVQQVADALQNTALKADIALAQLIGDLEAHKPALMQQHGSLIRHLNACLAADALTRTA